MRSASVSAANVAFGTPNLIVRDNRGQAARSLSYNRQSVGAVLDERIERTTYDALGRATSQIDARLFASTGSPQPNFVYASSLSGRVLRSDSVDAGTRWTLLDVEGHPVWAHDGRDTTTTWTYDAVGRPLSLQETLKDQPLATREIWVYGETNTDAQRHNQRGRCVCRYDMAGKLSWSCFRLTGQPLDETRQLLADAEAEPDWKGADASANAGALDASVYTSTWVHDATGAWLIQADAKKNVQQRIFDVAGRLVSSSVTLYQQAQAHFGLCELHSHLYVRSWRQPCDDPAPGCGELHAVDRRVQSKQPRGAAKRCVQPDAGRDRRRQLVRRGGQPAVAGAR